jgi:hypothetical protein
MTSPAQAARTSIPNQLRRQKQRLAKKARTKKIRRHAARATGHGHAAAGGLFLLCVTLLVFRHRAATEQTAAGGNDNNADGAGRQTFQPKAVFLAKTTSPDPATMDGDAADGADDKDEAAAVAAAAEPLRTGEIRLIGPGTDNGPKAASEVRVSPPTALPAVFANHFPPLPGEKLLKHTTFNVPLLRHGDLAITSRRILALYTQYTFKLLPPRRAAVVKRHQVALAQVSAARGAYVARPVFLVAGALLCWLYPAGTLLSAGTVAAYFGVRRRELGVFTASGERRTYPVDGDDVVVCAALIAAAQERAARTAKKRRQATPKVS